MAGSFPSPFSLLNNSGEAEQDWFSHRVGGSDGLEPECQDLSYKEGLCTGW